MDTPTWSALEPFLDQALDTPPTEREGWLAALARERPDIAETLRGLLRERDELDARGFMATPLVPQAPTLAGVRVGAYTIRSLIGRGGMGEVWLADRSVGRFEGRFAVKFIDAYAASAAGLDRFRREGRLLARLAHEHIARLIDAGVTASERPYLVLEYIEGDRIDRYCEAQGLDVPARVRLVLDVLGAVAHAHANLIVHRDIKPSNVLVTAGGSTKLLDFGIAKLVTPEDAADAEAATRIEDAALTPEYAAPEQILGEPASTATDVYQLGVLLFVLLAGRLPLAATGSSRAERVKAALDAEPPRLSDAAASSRRRELRGDLDAIVAKCLRKLPHERYATAAALAEDLKRYLAGEPVQARTGALGYRLTRFVRRYRTAVLGTALAGLSLLGITAFALLQMHEAQRQRDVSREQARRAERQSAFVTLMMSTVGDRPTTAAQLFSAGERLLHDHFPNDPTFRVNGLMNLAARYSDLGDTKKQAELTRAAAVLAAPLGDALLSSRVECGLAAVEQQAGHLDLGLAHLQAGEAQLQRVTGPDAGYVADCLGVRAASEDLHGHPQQAIATDLQAVALLERAGETADERYPGLLGELSDYYKSVGDSHNGYEYTRRALEALRANGLEDSDNYLTHSHNLASAQMGFGEIRAGCQLEGEVQARYQASGRQVVPTMAGVYASCLGRLGRWDEALHWADLAVAGTEESPDLSQRVFAHYARARALVGLGRLADAEAQMRQLDELARRDPVGLQAMRLRAEMVRLDLRMAEGRLDEARRGLAAAVAQLREPLRAQGRLLPGALLLSARLANREQRFTDAAAFSREALQLSRARARQPDDSADVGDAALALAEALRGLNDEAGRRQAAAQALRSFSSQLGADSAPARRAAELGG